MLYSKEECTKGKSRPHFSLWFGNFFEPYYSDKELVCEGMKEIADMGFNSIILDSKLWEDFTEFFETGKESDYVAMQRFMIERCKENGMGINFLALFYNGDNLYPHIRDSAPDIISPVIDRDGKPFRGYKHWDSNQTEALAEHTANLYRKLAMDAAAKAEDGNGNQRIPCYFYHSPAIMPSFDEDGKRVYTNFLKEKYGNIESLNGNYKTEFESFDKIDQTAVWPVMKTEDYKNPENPRMAMHLDNMLFRNEIMESFYKELTDSVRQKVPGIFLYDCLSQWKYLLPDCVEISERGLDIWTLGKYLDCPSFYTLPADSYGEANCYVVSCENAILRSASREKDIVSGLFLGRYLYNDIYSYVTPAEAIASSYGAGATDMFFYGYSGLDDGGNFGKWSEDRKRSVKVALDWFSDVREVSGKRVSDKKAAILFPKASFVMDNRRVNDAEFRACRNDFLGIYEQFADLGINADVLDRSQINGVILNDYSVIALPSDPFYPFLPDKALENALRDFVAGGGTVICSASCGLQKAFDINVYPHADDSFEFEEKVTEFSEHFYSFDNVEAEAFYCSDRKIAIGKKSIGKGTVYVAGIDMGRCYCERRHKPVPVAYGKENHYPLTVIKRTPTEKWLMDLGLAEVCERGIEKIAFENGTLIINHTSYDYRITEKYNRALATEEGFSGVLHGHHSVFLLNTPSKTEES